MPVGGGHIAYMHLKVMMESAGGHPWSEDEALLRKGNLCPYKGRMPRNHLLGIIMKKLFIKQLTVTSALKLFVFYDFSIRYIRD